MRSTNFENILFLPEIMKMSIANSPHINNHKYYLSNPTKQRIPNKNSSFCIYINFKTEESISTAKSIIDIFGRLISKIVEYVILHLLIFRRKFNCCRLLLFSINHLLTYCFRRNKYKFF
jgi:hypothetical protein